jgi:dolichol-phosphate mannosyltransferase
MAVAQVEIVIPVYNEGENIRSALEQIHQKVTCPYHVVIVHDFDEDNTLPVARQVQKELGLPLTFKRNSLGRGVLGAIRTGLETAVSPWVIVTMADISDPPEVINALLKQAVQQQLDLVCASRYMRGGKQIGGPWLKGLLSKTAGLTLHWFAGIPTHDATNSFKLYRHELIRQIPIESTGGFELGIELVVKAHRAGFRIGEVPTTWRDRPAGQSRFQMRNWLPKYIKWYLLAFAPWSPHS